MGYTGVQHPAEILVTGQLPHPLAGGGGALLHLRGQGPVIGKGSAAAISQRRLDTVGECGNIHDAIHAAALLGIRHGVGQSDAALGIGVVHLNIPPGHGADHIARHIGRGGELILASRHHAGNIDPKAPLLRRPQGGHHSGRAAHIMLHGFHKLRRLEGVSAAVVGKALADQPQAALHVLRAGIFHDNELRLVNRALSDLQKSGESDALYLISAVNGHLHRRLLKKLLCRLRQLGGGKHRGGLIDQIPCDAGGLSRYLRLHQGGLVALRRLAEKRSRFDPRRRRGRLVLVKTVAGKSGSLCRLLEERRRELRAHAPQIGTHRTQIQLLTLTIHLGTALQHLLQAPVFPQTQQENLGQHAL